MKLYHGSTVIVKHPSVQKGRKATDFGKGFYTTINLEQALHKSFSVPPSLGLWKSGWY